MLPFSIQLQDGTPVSDQILLAVRKALLTGQMKPGDVFEIHTPGGGGYGAA